MRIHWHRRDLRLEDNPPLVVDEGPIVPVFVIDTAVIEHAGPPRIAYLLDALARLREGYESLGSSLVILEGDPAEELTNVAAQVEADRVSWSREYTGLGRRRDSRVERCLERAGRTVSVRTGEVFHEPGTITTSEGGAYKVFSYYHRKWAEREKPTPANPPPEEWMTGASRIAEWCGTGSIPSIDELGWDEPEANIPAAGAAAARGRLRSFCADAIFDYAETRDTPALEGTSRLSQDLAFGTIGIRAVWAATESAFDRATGEAERASVREFQRQLCWREFYTQLLAANPAAVYDNYRSFSHPIHWRNDPDEFAAWTAGTTGFPIVDAGMRQLLEEAFMPNRLRMIVASFLTKDLLTDWRKGYVWFKRHLVDHDTANEVGGWQWAASTGADAQPYFRIFNPQRQSETVDPEGRYIKRYVPALMDVSAEHIHAWPQLSETTRRELAPTYPDPIVDHQIRRTQALEMYEAAMGE